MKFEMKPIFATLACSSFLMLFPKYIIAIQKRLVLEFF